jgi:hypothetical protein
MNKKLKSIPKFRSEAEERRFWQTHGEDDLGAPDLHDPPQRLINRSA